ncbi:4932_t:CDS:2 [Funneliformis mosseae]|uniref:4932_t:CDS:1 n=1 Tax=Funneliformis mosseae TaxID=27381 RepID=A0A9N9GKL2_FUNMO|nr:4932_t:CDS:2 [Funneliformis mosseae]
MLTIKVISCFLISTRLAYNVIRLRQENNRKGGFAEIIGLTNHRYNPVITAVIAITPKNLLQDAINACRSNSGDVIDSTRVQIVNISNESQPCYCEIIPDNLLPKTGVLQGIKIYYVQTENLFQTHKDPLTRFVNILKRLAEVFQLKHEAIHVFYDKDSSSIAFNRGKALYFNLKIYLELHEEESSIKITSNAMTYWFITACHELAHNFTTEHNSTHEVTSFFIVRNSLYAKFLRDVKEI